MHNRLFCVFRCQGTRRFFELVMVLFFLILPLYASNESGNPFICNFSPDEYQAHPQNWSIVQDQRGIIYVGNNYGVLEFDGENWLPLVVLDNKSMARTLAIDAQGVVYVGGTNEFGYLAINAQGSHVYVSLSQQRELPKFQDIQSCFVVNKTVYFVSESYIFCYENNTVTPVQLYPTPKAAVVDGDSLLIGRRDSGIYRIQHNHAELIPGTEQLSWAGYEFLQFLPYEPGKIIIVSSLKGFQIFSLSSAKVSEAPIPLDTEVTTYLKANILDNSLRVNADLYAFSTKMGGILLTNRLGKPVMVINKPQGLLDSGINNLWVDQAENLWVASNYGIAYIELSSPLTRFNVNNGLDGIVLTSHRHQGRLYVGNFKGIFYLPDPGLSINNGYFRPVENISDNCFDLISIGDILIGSAGRKLFQIKGNQAKMVMYTPPVFSLCASAKFPDHLFLGTMSGLVAVHLRKTVEIDNKAISNDDQSSWIGVELIHKDWFAGIDQFVRKIVCDERGNLWVSTEYNGIVYIRFLHDGINDFLVTRYTDQHGLPGIPKNTAHIIDGQLLVGTEQGLYQGVGFKNDLFDPAKLHFELETNIGLEFARHPKRVIRLNRDSSGNYWISLMSGFGISRRQNNGSYLWDDIPFRKINGYIESFRLEEDGTAWLCGVESRSLFRFDATQKKNYHQDYPCLIRQVKTGKNTLLFAGTYYQPIQEKNGFYRLSSFQQPQGLNVDLSYTENSVYFNYAATFYEHGEKNRFQYFLQGYQTEWSDWSEKNEKEFTNLAEGDYRFMVRAKNIFEHQSSIAEYCFSVSPPWFRSYWAYAGYLLVSILFIYGTVLLNSQRLLAAKKRLEKIVLERTEDLVMRNMEITQQKEQIERYAGELELTKNALWGEMQLAKKIQTVLLPDAPAIPGYEIAAMMKPADEVGGDYYDVIEIKGEWLVDGGQWLDDPGRAEEKDKEPCRCGSCARPIDFGQFPKTNPENPPNLLPGQPQGFAPTGLLSTNHYPPTTAPKPTHWLVIGDVSGHGVPAGLIMMMVQTAIHSVLETRPDYSPAEVLSKINRVIRKNIQKMGEDKYMTITLMLVAENGRIHYSGLHQDLLVYREKTKKTELIATRGMWLGIVDHIEDNLSMDSFTMESGDALLLYTDGIVEATDAQGNMFSEETLLELFTRFGHLPPHAVKTNLLQALNDFTCADDVTLMIIKKL